MRGCVCLYRVSQYRFCQIMAENLPKLREEIKDVSMSDLKDFLESIRKHSDKVGETAIRQVGPGVTAASSSAEWLGSIRLTVSCAQAQQHRTFISTVAKQAGLDHYTKPLFSLNGRAHSHMPNGLLMDDGAGDEEDADDEVRTYSLVCIAGLSVFVCMWCRHPHNCPGLSVLCCCLTTTMSNTDGRNV